MLTQMTMRNFKGFSRYSVRFGERAVLIGPNNAGKSTLISAVRLCAAAVRLAQRRNPAESFQDGSRWVRGYPLSLVTSEGFIHENVRHEFRDVESRVELKFASGIVMKIVWPVGEPAFFWLHEPTGNNNVTAARARELCAPIGIVPTLTPFESDERKLETRSIRPRIETKLASRHFRNHLREAKLDDPAKYADLVHFLVANTPEIDSLEIADDYRDGNVWIDLYYRDHASAVEKEIYWAGDGLQIWLQLLFHLWRCRDLGVVVLDEPDVFLHPDLQRRLIQLLQSRPGQFLLATHAAEIASEAEQGSVVWIDRQGTQAVSPRDDRTFAELSDVLGTGFNLSLARTLRSRLTLFIEGQDMKIIRRIASTLGLTQLAEERRLATVALGGFSRSPSVDAFAWVRKTLVGDAMPVTVVLDRDYRLLDEIDDIEARFKAISVEAHVWRRKEIENYLFNTEALAREAGISTSDCEALLDAACEDMRPQTQSQYIARRLEEDPKAIDPATSVQRALSAFEAQWAKRENRITMAPGKRVLSRFNHHLQLNKHRTVDAVRVASALTVDEIPVEMRSVLGRIEEHLR